METACYIDPPVFLNDDLGILMVSYLIITILARKLALRDDYKFMEMIGQKPLLAIMLCNLIGHP